MIFQPRKFHISTDTKSVEELLHWENTELRQRAELAFKGEGTVEYGPWLQFSNCNAVLRVRKDYHDKLKRFQLASPLAKIAEENGYTNIYRKNLITLTDMQKLMGRDKFNELLGNHIYKPQGKATLVPMSDKRKALVMHNVKQEFKEEK